MLSSIPYRFGFATKVVRRWDVRRLAGVSNSKLSDRLLNDFTLYLNGQRGEEAVFNLLKRCSTGLKAELPKTRVSLAAHVCATMKEKGFIVDTKMYNCLLRVYLTNRHSFSPAEFLSTMRDEGIIPNRGTLSMLLEAYCQQGNMTGAKQILSELKIRGLSITEDIYASLISGHAESGNMDSALQIIELMKKGECPPGRSAYSALLAGYAYQGDLDSIKELISSLKKDKTFVSYIMFSSMIDAMSRGGHHQKIPELMSMIRNKEWMYNSLLLKAEDLSSRGEINSCIILLNSLGELSLFGEGHKQLLFTYITVLKHMVMNEEPLDALLSHVSSFKTPEDVSVQVLYAELFKTFFLNEKWNEGKAVLVEMHKRGHVIRPHYLYPPIVACVKNNDIKGHFQWLRLLDDLDLVPDSFIAEFTTKALQKVKKDIIQFLQDENIPLSKGLVRLISRIYYYNRQYDALYAKLRAFDESILPAADILGMIATFSRMQPPKVETLTKFYSFLAPMCEEKQVHSSLYTTVFNLTNASPGKNVFVFVKSLLSQKIDVPNDTCNLVLSSLNEQDCIDDFFKFLGLMKTHGIKVDNNHRRQILKVAAKTSTPFAALNAFNQMKEDGVVDSNMYSNLIVALCRSKKMDLALEHYHEVSNMPEYQLSFVAYTYVIQAFVSKGDLQSAIDIRKSKILDRGLKPGLFMFNIFLEGYAKIGDLENLQAEFSQMVAANVKPSAYSYDKLMQGYAYHNDIDNVKRVFKEAEAKNISINKEMVSTLVKTCVAQNDLKSAIDYLDQYSNIRPLLKTFADFIKASVMQNETEMTDRAVEILKKNGVSLEAINHIVMFAISSCGRLDEAFEFAKKSGLRINLDIVNNFAKSCHVDGNYEDLLSLMSLLRMFGMKAHMLHIPLIKAYAVSGNVEPLLTIGKDLEHLGEAPKPSFHTTLSTLLKEHSEEVPYVLAGSEKLTTSNSS